MLRHAKAFSSFSVNNLEKAIQFYRETLELEVSTAYFLELYLEGGGRVFIYPKPDHTPATYTALNFEVENIDEAIDGLTRKGVKFLQYHGNGLDTDAKGIQDNADHKIAWFEDPAGNILSVIQQVKQGS